MKHVLCEILMRNDFHSQILEERDYVVTEVRMSADLKIGKVYVLFLNDINLKNTLKQLNDLVPQIRKILAQKVSLKFLPKFRFIYDVSVDNAKKISKLLH